MKPEQDNSYIDLQKDARFLSEIVQDNLVEQESSNVLFRLVMMPSNYQQFYCIKMIDGEQTIHRHYFHTDEGLVEANKFYEGLKCQAK